MMNTTITTGQAITPETMTPETMVPETLTPETIMPETFTEETAKSSASNDDRADLVSGGRVDLSLTGMTCNACARRSERRLTNAQGVRSANVNFATARATVEYDRSATGAEQLIETVREIGYGASDAAEEGASEKEQEAERAEQQALR